CRRLRAESGLKEAYRLCEAALRDIRNGARNNPEEFLRKFIQSAARIVVPQDLEPVKAPDEWGSGGLQAVLRRRQGQGPPSFSLGLEQTSRMVSVEPGHLMILAAETGKGKTAFALNIASHIGISNKIPTLYVNTEMSWEELSLRLYAILGGVSLFSLRNGSIGASDVEKVRQVYDNLSRSGNALYITDAMPWFTHREVEALIREYAVLAGIRVVIVDYIQRLDADDASEDGWVALLRACKALKSLAQELKMLVVVVAQLADQDRLAGSRGMAREADVVLFLEEEDDLQADWTHRLKIAKARHSASNVMIRIRMDRTSLRMTEVSPNKTREDGVDAKKKGGRRKNGNNGEEGPQGRKDGDVDEALFQLILGDNGDNGC
ncbi:MAG: DnaB-like helicase C-terminal domain-containing protein, partial [Anaerolineae bacterium]